ncbi:ribonuclease R [Endozoicomonas sp. GU-1]|uniref:ribonuclease R n=1 Tax=Endozoicomonas sp. GU-1 TaxID=3009078 RepID=UPI0022B2E356|nr:ribonuclease R [Endozoicomonas sp. GU-1]WBA80993.1 ribonuclease R [Endozoicomonas sp. GU-1]WBA88561.1 ribonuclease R [Endozoicomonas sp. GU-1]
MSKGWKSQDSQASLEAERYENPIPSRLYIMEYLEQRGAPVSHRALCRALGINDEEQQEALMFRLKAMIRDGQLLQNRKNAFALISKLNLIKGVVQGNKEGFGFLMPDGGGEDLYLSPREMRQLFDGDRAVVRESGVDHRGRREGQLVEVIERNTTQVVGRYYTESGAAFMVPENPRISREIIVQPGPLMPTEGQYILLEITRQPGRRNMPMGIVKEILGGRADAGMEVEVAVRTHNIPHDWPEAVEKQCQGFTTEVAESDKNCRVDLRATPFVTIDGEDARDFDDAVYCESKKGGGWRLFVAIADVSHYVKPGSALDKEAVNRGTSVYFPGHVIPMLPEVLSNGLCSLNPEVDRLAMVCEMTISGKGKISGYKFYESVIRSHARLTYTKVWDMLSLGDEGRELRKQYQPLVPHLEHLYSLYKTLVSVRAERGTIDFDTVETQIIFGRHRKIEQIVPRERNDAHKLIEECMLCANVCAAKFLEKHKLPGLYRVHEGPTLEKKLNLNSFIGSLGLALPSGKITPRDIQALLLRVKDRPDYHVIQTVVLRSMSQAVYSGDNQGHFGLAFKAYAHFTSPIRRYPDLLVHRAIRHIIRSESPSRHVLRVGASPIPEKRIYPYNVGDIQALGEHCSTTERRADLATRDAMGWLKCDYMQQHIGQTFSGIVSSVTGFGLFVELKDVYVEGLVHVTSLPDDYYIYDNVHHCMRGERTGRRFGLGDELEVMVSKVNLDDKKIDFELLSALSRPGRRKSSGKSGSAKKSRSSASAALGSRFKSAAAKEKLLREARAAEEAAKKGKGTSSAKGTSSNKGSAEDGKPSGRKTKGRKSAKTTGKKGKPTASGKKKTTGKKKASSARKSDSAKASKPTGKQPRKRKISQ